MKKALVKNRIPIVMGLFIVLLLSFIGYLVFNNPATQYPLQGKSDGPEYKMDDSYFISETGSYECSKKIKLKKTFVTTQSMNRDKYSTYNYVPVDQAEADLLCHMTSAIEYKGKIEVLQKPEVAEMIERYGYNAFSIKALEFKYIKDEHFVDRLLPKYKDQEIGCIIILDTPEGRRVYFENEKLETIEELNAAEFEQQLLDASLSDRTLFYKNLG